MQQNSVDGQRQIIHECCLEVEWWPRGDMISYVPEADKNKVRMTDEISLLL
jgi:hypothetical protein